VLHDCFKSGALFPTRNSYTQLYAAKLGYMPTANSRTVLITQLKLAFRFGGFSGVSYELSTSHSYFRYCLSFQGCHQAL